MIKYDNPYVALMVDDNLELMHAVVDGTKVGLCPESPLDSFSES